MAQSFEHEERYKVVDLDAVRKNLEAAGFGLHDTEQQIDHWFIPEAIMSPEAQGEWFDNDRGNALRIREEVTKNGRRGVITTKQVLVPHDHTSMTSLERDLTVEGMMEVLGVMDDEFTAAIAQLRTLGDPETELSYADAKQLIEAAGRKEYITLDKTRMVFVHPLMSNVVVDIDSIPALQQTELGFSATVELEYTGAGTLDEAKQVVGDLRTKLGYKEEDLLTKALPGLAIPYLAYF